ncbi:MAG: fused MFS/spermidine synthase [Deltaproteobacteria bacterium]|nr:fused MFS/spermidine synthase [Deltaproteobacteria bacterium]
MAPALTAPAVIALGISHIITQITVAREAINVQSGNELVLGVVIALWFLLSGLGARLGAAVKSATLQLRLFRSSLIIAALLPILQILSIRLLRNVFFLPGEIPGLLPTTLFLGLIMTPYCLVTGAALAAVCGLTKPGRRQEDSIGRVYFLDNLGDILGGLLFTFLLVRWFSTLTVLLFPALLLIGLHILMRRRTTDSRASRYGPGLTAALLVVSSLIVLPLDDISLRQLYPSQKLLGHAESPYGRIVVTELASQISFFENGAHLFSIPDIYASEEIVHFAMGQREAMDSVLIVSGGVAGVIDEIVKYRPSRIDYVELDPGLIKMSRVHAQAAFPSTLSIHIADGRRFLSETSAMYDAVLVGVGDPRTLQLNRFYTVEFFREVSSHLMAGGILAFAVAGSANYISDEQAELLATLEKTVRQVFSCVLIVPGERQIFLASNGPLTLDVLPRLHKLGIPTVFMNEHYVPDRLSETRLASLADRTNRQASINRDFHPAAYMLSLAVWLSMFREHYRYPLLLAAFLIVLCFARLDIAGKTIFSTGVVASSVEVTILLLYQIVNGSVYSGIGMIIASFMIGLAGGSFAAVRIKKCARNMLISLEAGIILYLLIVCLILNSGGKYLNAFTIAILTTSIGFLAGAEFPVAGRSVDRPSYETAGLLYAADFTGAAAGAFLSAVFLIPFIGILRTLLLLFLGKFLILAFIISRKKEFIE